jgi:RNA polymerase sigma-70 factor (ECF subfamily)
VNSNHKSSDEILQELRQIEAAKSNPANFAVLYEKYYKPIFIFIHRRTGDEEVSGDITSQVFLKALMNIKKYEFKGVPFSAWLFRIAFNEVNMHFRKNHSERVISINQNGIIQIAQEADVDDNADGLQKMMAALKQLEEPDIQLIELRFFEKRSFAEVGDIIGITENNAKVKVYRILDKLKMVLKTK